MRVHDEKNAVAFSSVVDRTMPEELNAECLLPDYKGAISRLLWVRPVFSETGYFVSGGKVDFSGRVRFDALYMNADGVPETASCEENYGFSMPVDLNGYDTEAGVTFDVTVLPEAVVTRVAAPRRLTLRCRFCVRVRGYAGRSLSAALPEGAADRVEALCDMAEYGRHFAGQGRIETAGEMPFEGDGEPVVLDARGALYLPDVSAAAGGVRCAGEVIVTLLCRRENADHDEVFTLQKRLPFEELIAADGVTSDCTAAAEGAVIEVRATAEPGLVSLVAAVRLSVTATAAEPVFYVRDLFLPGHTATCRSEEVKLPAPGASFNRHFSVSSTRAREGVLPAGAMLIDAFGEAEVLEKTVENGRTALAGTLVCHLLYRMGGEYAASEADFTFRVNTEGDLSAAEVRASLPVLRLTEEGDALRADGEVQLAVTAGGEMTVRRIADAVFAPEVPRSAADMELCYPASGETLWDVACRYGVSPAAIAAENGIEGDDPGNSASLDGVRWLLIPRVGA